MLKKWFDFLDKCVLEKRISLTVFRSNIHHVCHIPRLVRLLGSLFYHKVSGMEQQIGFYKFKVDDTTKEVGVHMENILEKRLLFGFLQMNEIIDFDGYFTKPFKPTSYFDNPSNPGSSELWAPFITRKFKFQ